MSELHNTDRLEPVVDVNLHIFKQSAYYFNFIDKNIYKSSGFALSVCYLTRHEACKMVYLLERQGFTRAH